MGPIAPISSVWGSLVTGGFAAGGIPYVGSDNNTYVDLANLFWDATNKRLSVATAGDTTGTDSINSYAQQDTFQFQSAVPASPWLSNLPAAMTVSSSRGNANVPTALQNGDYVGGFFGWGNLQVVAAPAVVQYYPIAGIWGVISGVNAGGNYGGELHFGTKADAGVFTDLMLLSSAGILQPTVSEIVSLGKAAFPYSALFLGYTNSGGVGAQAINKSSGRSGIAAGQTVVVITNNKVSATSVVLAQLETVDATLKSLTVAVAGGSFSVTGNAAATAQVAFSFLVVGN